MTLLEAIGRMEGFYDEGTRPNRNNSPGDLIWGSEAESFGATHGDGRYAVFPYPTTGWNALRRWLSVPARFSSVSVALGQPKGPSGYLIAGYLGATLEQILWRFAPPNENNPTAYLDFVTSKTGLTPGTIITAALLQTPEEV